VAMSAEARDDDTVVQRSLGIHGFVPEDGHFVTHMCDVIGSLCEAKRGPNARA
jgi:hypothetical protein